MTRILCFPHFVAARRGWCYFRESLFSSPPIPIVAIPPVVYDERRARAEELIADRDLKDVDILALALKFNAPLWTNDRDFDSLPQIEIFATADMLEWLAAC